MISYIIRRFIAGLITIWAATIISFIVIQLPPGDFVTSYIANLQSTGTVLSQAEADALRQQYGLDRPIYIQYAKWMGLMLQGNFGMAMEYNRPVREVIGDRMTITIIVSLAAVFFIWVVSLPIGIYSPDMNLQPWGWPKIWDMIKHLPVPAIIIGMAGMAEVVRILRANLLDELRKPYVVTARAKGLAETRVILKYPVRAAMNPFASTIGYIFPFLVSGSIIVSLVLSLPTVGPLLYKALIAQDLFLSGTILLMLAILTVVGTFISDLLLMWIDPRIRHGMESGN